MKKHKIPMLWIGTMMVFLAGLTLQAQTTYMMSNTTVNECDGILTDSDAGDVANTYDHNENFTFRICVPQAEKITINFISFCTEDVYDILRIYDGPDTLSNLIGGPYTGTLGAFSVTATSGCMTINFISDPNIACVGWVAVWKAQVAKPIPPSFLPMSNVPCGSNEIILQLDKPIPCNNINASSFIVFGAKSYPVSDATPVNCINGMTSTIKLTLSSPIDFSGGYTIRFNGVQIDECGDAHNFSIETGFSVTDCPLAVVLSLDPWDFCAGHCTWLTATANGGDPNTYQYKWSPNAPAVPTIQVCTSTPITYTVTVTDGAGSVPAVASIVITPLTKPVLPQDTTLCQTNPALWIPHTLPGGTWYGRGINPDRRWENRWDAWRLGNALIDTVIYVAPNGCMDTMIINKLPLNQGGQNAACPGAPPFKVSGGSPAGGIWTGPFIATDGWFDPSTPGNYLVTYTHPNGCSGSKWVNVANLVMPPDDTICSSKDPFNIPVTPFGGTWSGTGITNAGNGRFEPLKANLGNNLLTYTAQGCSGTVNIHVREIDAAWDLIACPFAPPFILPGNWTPGGVWTGAGILDSLTGLYDPSIKGHGVDEKVTLSFDGCSDSRIIYIRETAIYSDDTLRFCVEDSQFELNWDNVRNSPWNGGWTGAGTFQNPADQNKWYFSPTLAGPGMHTLVYSANGCQDSMVIQIYAPPAVRPDTVCVKAAPYLLESNPPSSWWQGTGIINPNTGLFDPVAAGQGNHVITTVSTTGCAGGGVIVVQAPDTVTLTGLEPVYCHRDTQIQIIIAPPGGQLTIDGLAATPSFNPAQRGPGLHTIRYRIGTGECQDEKVRYVQVGPPVGVAMAFKSDTICFAQGKQISAEGTGGSTLGNFSYQWSQGLGFGKSHLVLPSGSSRYRVTVTDGCSDPAIDSLEVIVRAKIQLSFQTGPKVCYGDTTFATVQATPAGNYEYTWQTNPPRVGAIIQGLSGNYTVEAEDINTGCSVKDKVTLPGFKPIQANFIVSPQGECVTILEPYIEILDFSNGAVTGTWDFGDGRVIPYIQGQNLAHTYRDTGVYQISLIIRNEGGCISTHQDEVCVRAVTTLFIPNAFTANSDGRNDAFRLVGRGVEDITWQIYDRWGTLLFEGRSMTDQWDGNYKGQPMPQGTYLFKARYKTLYQDSYQDASGSVMLLR